METQDIKDFYNRTVGGSTNKYEYDRWQKNSQGKASYISTHSAVVRYALPLLRDCKNILEVGPGPGTWTKLLIKKASNAKYCLVDISEEMLKQSRESLVEYSDKITFIHSDVLDFKPDMQYDFFFSSRIIEYVPNKKLALQIISDSLRSGAYGYIVTKTPHSNRFWGIKNNSPVHQNQISATDFTKIIKGVGCEIEKIVNVTSVFPGARNGFLDRILTEISRFLPFVLAEYFSESYAIVFRKK